ncbi:MAG TPA: Glu-tRNA(Gln) amidotransferase subunit GatD, partial [Candidatus Aenigmarchaeota archaeon]|nr:Glu-tRNA(Gln) amidotransferase subunit GatD [Candidatus Aenigmarchaeota archaeon]
DWQKIAIAVGKKLNSSASGVIITHGTDTMHFTSAALSFMLKNLNKPVVLVGAQRSSDRGSSDAAMNVICATHIAVSDIAEVGVCMHASSNDDWCYFIRGTKVRKMHTSRRDAFRPINDRPIAKINQDGRLEILSSYRKRNDNKVEVDTRFEKRTALIKVYPGADPDIVEFMVNKGYRGFVIEATGLGHVPTFSKRSWIPYIKRYARDGIPFVIAPQTLYGRINMNVYTSGRILLEAGAIPGFDMLPEVAYVKLGWVLAHTSDIEEVRRLMTTNLAGEIAERSVHDTFLF